MFLFFGLVGGGMTYGVLAMIFNRTEVEILPDGVRVWSGPLPWRGNKSLAASEITKLRLRTRRRKNLGTYFDVMYVDADGRELPLATRCPSPDQATFILRAVRQNVLGSRKHRRRARSSAVSEA